MILIVLESLLLATIVLVSYRLWRGPTPWDRLLAYNAASNRIAVLLVAVAVTQHKTMLLDLSIVYAALSFLGVAVLARFMERGEGFR